MRIIEEYDKENELLYIINAEYKGKFSIQIYFNDGTEQNVSFKSFLENSNHPSIKKYLDEDLFKKFDIVHGNLNWNDYDMIFPIWNLYKGNSLD